MTRSPEDDADPSPRERITVAGPEGEDRLLAALREHHGAAERARLSRALLEIFGEGRP